jgi:HD-GYP domain-containing protein (c-di-GMP phosphodiesterase class II)
MLKKVPIRQLRLGMHLHALEGPWMSHPFWRTRFTLVDPADLQKLRDSGVAECWIDVAKGLDVAPEAPPLPSPKAAAPRAAGPAGAASAAAAAAAPAAAASAPRESSDFNAELQQAAAICRRGREAINSMFHEARLGRSIDTEGCLPLVEEISNSVFRNPGALVSLARLKTQDDYSYMHSVAVCALMVALARQLGLPDDECREAGLAGLVHDVGKAVLPLEILNKPGKLTEAEFAVVRTHPERGHALLQEGHGASEAMLDVVLHHHERIDGRGYPQRLEGERLSRIARMGAVCDVYDAITSNRPYKAGWDPAESIAAMAGWRGQFDETIFNAFVRSLGIYPTGSLVRLQSGLVAVVAEQNPQALVSPVVVAFYSTKSELPIAPRRIDLARPGCSDRITGREPNTDKRYPRLDELWAGPDALRRVSN